MPTCRRVSTLGAPRACAPVGCPLAPTSGCIFPSHPPRRAVPVWRLLQRGPQAGSAGRIPCGHACSVRRHVCRQCQAGATLLSGSQRIVRWILLVSRIRLRARPWGPVIGICLADLSMLFRLLVPGNAHLHSHRRSGQPVQPAYTRCQTFCLTRSEPRSLCSGCHVDDKCNLSCKCAAPNGSRDSTCNLHCCNDLSNNDGSLWCNGHACPLSC